MFKALLTALVLFIGAHTQAAEPAYEGTRISTATGQATKRLNGVFYIGRSSPTWDAPESTPTIKMDGASGGVDASSFTAVYGLKAASATITYVEASSITTTGDLKAYGQFQFKTNGQTLGWEDGAGNIRAIIGFGSYLGLNDYIGYHTRIGGGGGNVEISNKLSIGAGFSPAAEVHISTPAQIGSAGQSPGILIDGNHQARGNLMFRTTGDAAGQQITFQYPTATRNKAFGFDSNYNAFVFWDFDSGLGTSAIPQIILGPPTVGARFGVPADAYTTYPLPQAQVHISSGVAGRSLYIDGNADIFIAAKDTFTVTGTGVVGAPSQPFGAIPVGAAVLTNGVSTKMFFASPAAGDDIGGLWGGASSSGTFTTPASGGGTYNLLLNLYTGATGAGTWVVDYKIDGIITRGCYWDVPSGANGAACNARVKLTAGQTVEVFINQTGTVDLVPNTNPAYSYFVMDKVW